MRVLCTGDIHIGRSSSRPSLFADDRTFSCASCWKSIVDLAIDRQVDLVALSGDVVDRANRFYEALGPLQAGVRRLGDAGIETMAVAGNHDFDVLTRLADSVDANHFRLLGRGGRWERHTIDRDGRAVLHVDGWSFPAESVHASPLASYDLPHADDAPVLGLLHADLGVAKSKYAPVSLADLRARACTLWLLGHIHHPTLHEAAGSATVLYPGSPQAMDAGERGSHGVWIADLGPGRQPALEHVPLSTIRYEAVDVDLDGADDEQQTDARIHGALGAALESAVNAQDSLRVLSCRLRVSGRTRVYRAMPSRLIAMREKLEMERERASLVIDDMSNDTRPPIDLDALARGDDAAGLLARLLLSADGGPPSDALAALLEDADRRAQRVAAARPYQALERAPAEDGYVARIVRAKAVQLLDELLTMKAAR